MDHGSDFRISDSNTGICSFLPACLEQIKGPLDLAND